MNNLYIYEFITKNRTDLIQSVAECLAKAFTEVDILGKWI